jgi:ATP-dependent RNA helicase DDX27
LRSKVEEAEREAERAENMMLFEAEIVSRPARTWYQTETQKKELRDAGKLKAKEEEERAEFGEGEGAETKKRLKSEARAAALAR